MKEVTSLMVLKSLPMNFMCVTFLAFTLSACSVSITAPKGLAPDSAAATVLSAPAVSYSGAISATVGVAISSSAPTNLGGAISSCAISPSLNSDTGLTFSTTTCVISGTATTAQRATAYTVTATNAIGDGTSTISVTSTLPVAPGVPAGLAVTAASASVINLDWTDTVGAASYTVKRYASALDAGNDANSTILVCADSAVSSCSSTGLTASTTYYYRVLATNAGGSSVLAAESHATTLVSPPSTPGSVAASGASATTISLDWDDMAGASSYTVKRYDNATDAGNDANSNTVTCADASVSACIVTGLTEGTAYYFRVLATNAGGASSLAAAQSALTYPAIPTGAAATAASASIVNLDWADMTGAATYTVKRYASAVDAGNDANSTTLVCADSSLFACQDTGRAAGTTYYYRISSSNASGVSAFAASVSALTYAATPTGLAATLGDTQVSLDWADMTGAASYTVKRYANAVDAGNDESSTSVTCADASVSACIATGLTNGTAYYFRVSATNASGTSALAAAVTETPAVAVPTAPTIGATSSVAQTTLTVAWTDNSSDETGFKFEQCTDSNASQTCDGGESWSETYTPAADAISQAVTGLTANTAYVFRVRAVNAGGDSAYSSVVAVTTLPNAPTAPSGLTVTKDATLPSSKINLAWTDASSDETGFKIERCLDADVSDTCDVVEGWAEIVSNQAADSTSYADTGLSVSTKYLYRIRAYNSGGNSAYTSIASDTTAASATVSCTLASTPGDDCGGGLLFAGTYSPDAGVTTYGYMTTPGNCTDSAAPTCDGTGDTLTKKWAANDTRTPSAYGTATGVTSSVYGGPNTDTLNDNYADADAASYCASMTYGGYADWYLPAYNELRLILYVNRASLSGFGGSYWSSSEVDSTQANRMSGAGTPFDTAKTTSVLIRCMRRFTPGPTIVSTSPANSETDVAVSTDVTITFSEVMDEPSVESDTNITFVKNSDSSSVAGTWTWDLATKTLTIDPTLGPLANSEVYTVTVTTNVKNAGGTAVASEQTFSFTTEASGGAAIDCSTATDLDIGATCTGGGIYAGEDTVGGSPYKYMTTISNCKNTTCTNAGVGGTDTLTLAWGTPGSTDSASDWNYGWNNWIAFSTSTDPTKNDPAASALAFCNSLNTGSGYAGHTDWYLPAESELDFLWTNSTQNEGSLGGFGDGHYWSSSNLGSNYGVSVGFPYGDHRDVSNFKDNIYGVRCVRRF